MILVTGGRGFIGRHLVARLRDQGHPVTVLDNGVTSRPGPMPSGVDVVVDDVVDPGWIDRVLAMDDVEEIYHLASPASPRDYARLPIETLRTGAEGTRNALECARRSGAKFLLASTSEVYGDPAVHPQPESYTGNVNLTGPRAVYDEAKRYAEAISYAYARSQGVDVGVARIFNTYGPGMRPEDGRVVSTFLDHASRGRPLPVHGDGSQTRSFCYVDDLVAGLMLLMRKGDARPVNLGNPNEVTILELARTIHEIVGRDTGIERLPLPQDDPTRRRPDITRARELGWEPKISLHDGLRRYAASLQTKVTA